MWPYIERENTSPETKKKFRSFYTVATPKFSHIFHIFCDFSLRYQFYEIAFFHNSRNFRNFFNFLKFAVLDEPLQPNIDLATANFTKFAYLRFFAIRIIFSIFVNFVVLIEPFQSKINKYQLANVIWWIFLVLLIFCKRREISQKGLNENCEFYKNCKNYVENYKNSQFW